MKSFNRDGWVLFCSSFTKTLAPDFRIGWIAGGRFNDALRKLKAVSSMAESQLLSETLAMFLETGGYDHHLRNLRKRYAAQVEAARALIARHFPRGTRATQPAGGFVFWVELPGGVDSVALFHQLLEEQICLTPGTLYSPAVATATGCGSLAAIRLMHVIPRRWHAWAKACEMSGLPPGIEQGE